MSVKFSIRDGCIGCGLCSMQYPGYFQEKPDGTAETVKGQLIDNPENAEEIAAVCPDSLIDIKEVIENKKQYAVTAIEKLKNFHGCPMPRKDDIPFKEEEYFVPTPSPSGEYTREFSSDSAAERGALNEFVGKMYSNIDNIILSIITKYRTKYILPYYTKDLADESVYAKTNKEASEILREVRRLVGDELPDDFDKVELFPDDDTVWKMLRNGELISQELISDVKAEFDYSADRYSCYWRTDSREELVRFKRNGDVVYKNKYYYYDLREAFDSLAEDLVRACYFAKDDIINRAIDVVGWLVNPYNEKLKKLLDERAALAESIVEKWVVNTKDKKVKLKKYSKKPVQVCRGDAENKEIFIVQANNGEQYFFNGKDLLRTYIKDGVIRKEALFISEQYQYKTVIGINGYIFFDTPGKRRLNYMYIYDVNTGNKHCIAEHEHSMSIVCNKIAYSKWSGINNYCTKSVYICEPDGSGSRLIASYSGGFKIVWDLREKNGKLHYYVADYDNHTEEYYDIDI